MNHFVDLLAKACEIAGRPEEAVTLLDEAIELTERSNMRWYSAESNRYKGQQLLRQGHTEAAEKLYWKALSIAAEPEAKLWELRAAVSLAPLLRSRRHRAEAWGVLAPIHGWFTEGFATPDLKEAQKLLETVRM